MSVSPRPFARALGSFPAAALLLLSSLAAAAARGEPIPVKVAIV
jgi:hypothetical protein